MISVMNDDQFTKLFKYIEKRFDDLDKRLEYVESSMAIKESIDTLIATIDSFAKCLEGLEVDLAARTTRPIA